MLLEADKRQKSPRRANGIGMTEHARPESHILEDRHPGKQRMMLEYNAAAGVWTLH
jgi:hypothetical protein